MLIWDEFIKFEFYWNELYYGIIIVVFFIVYVICMLFVGWFIDWMGIKKGYFWFIGIWLVGVCFYVFCGIIIEEYVGMYSVVELIVVIGDVVVVFVIISMYCFLVVCCILVFGEVGNFLVVIKVIVEYFLKKDWVYVIFIFNVGVFIGVLIVFFSILLLVKVWGWEMVFVIIGVFGFVWMGFWVFMYMVFFKNKFVNLVEFEYIE